MLDVHPPHEAAHSWRDFFIHIATIVIGLLIAIGLEQAVELIHHRHLAGEARESLRREFEDNRQRAAQDMQFLVDQRAALYADLPIAEKLRHHALLPSDNMSFTPVVQWTLLSDANWSLARDSGAALYLTTTEQQEYSRLYSYQDRFNTLMDANLQLLRTGVSSLYDASTPSPPPAAVPSTPGPLGPLGLDRLEQSMQNATVGATFPQVTPHSELSPERIDALEKGLREQIAYVETSISWGRTLCLRLAPANQPR